MRVGTLFPKKARARESGLRQITVNKAQLLQLAVQFQFSVVNGAPRRTGAAKTKRRSWEKAPKRLQTPKSEIEREREREVEKEKER